MAVYAIAQISINDRERYERYAQAFMPVLAQYKGRLLAADEHAEVIEGSWPHQKVILMSFAEREDFERWSGSPEYQEISKDRLASTDGVVLLLHGLQR
jgi:uncharacterized protein (DUF1330 family)